MQVQVLHRHALFRFPGEAVEDGTGVVRFSWGVLFFFIVVAFFLFVSVSGVVTVGHRPCYAFQLSKRTPLRLITP